jgi:hypothetical protein
VGASADALGFLLNSGGLLTTSDSRSPSLFVPQVFRPEYRNFFLFLILILLNLNEIAMAKYTI